jgi:hypothetical protein
MPLSLLISAKTAFCGTCGSQYVESSWASAALFISWPTQMVRMPRWRLIAEMVAMLRA